MLDTDLLPEDDEDSVLGRPTCARSPNVLRGDICKEEMAAWMTEGFASGLRGGFMWEEGGRGEQTAKATSVIGRQLL